jgi:hypothetical protein
VLVGSLLASPIAHRGTFSTPLPQGAAVSDFVLFYESGYLAKSPQRLHVYDPDVQMATMNRLIAPDHINKVFYCQYVPQVFVLMAPLAVLPINIAYTVWYFFMLGCGIFAINLLMSDEGRFDKMDRWLMTAAVVSSIPSMVALKIGQSSWFLVLFLSLFYLGLKYGREAKAGINLALFTIKPQYFPLFVVALFSARRWRIIAWAAAAEAVLLGISAVVLGWRNIINYPNIVLHADTTASFSGVNPESMVSLRSVLTPFLPQTAVVATSFALLLLGAVAVYAIWRAMVANRLNVQWAMALTTVACLVLSPHSHVYDLLLLSIPAALTLPSLGAMRLWQQSTPALRVWSFVLFFYPLLSYFAYWLGQQWIFVLMNVTLLASGLIHVNSKKPAG